MNVQAEILKWEQNCNAGSTYIWLELHFVVEKSKVRGTMTIGPKKSGSSIRSEAERKELGRPDYIVTYLR